jgi:hypothetical protein
VQKNDAENHSLYNKAEDATMYGRNYVNNYYGWTRWLKGGPFPTNISRRRLHKSTRGVSYFSTMESS